MPRVWTVTRSLHAPQASLPAGITGINGSMARLRLLTVGLALFGIAWTASQVAAQTPPKTTDQAAPGATQKKQNAPATKPDTAATAATEPKEESVDAVVTKVIDGDSIKAKDKDGKEHEIQIEGTDAPESKQPYGKESTDALRDMLADHPIRVTWRKKDNFERLLAQVYVGEKHINSEMIREGHAWHFKRYNQSEQLAACEAEAKKEKRGLWGTENPQAPWDYRKENRAPDKPDR